jgi:hypothetical protein
MKIIYYKKERDDLITPTFGYTDHCFYVPEKDIILYKRNQIMGGKPEYKSTNKPELLAEAKQIEQMGMPRKLFTRFSRQKRFEYDDSKLDDIIKGSEDALKKGIEDLIRRL